MLVGTQRGECQTRLSLAETSLNLFFLGGKPHQVFYFKQTVTFNLKGSITIQKIKKSEMPLSLKKQL